MSVTDPDAEEALVKFGPAGQSGSGVSKGFPCPRSPVARRTGVVEMSGGRHSSAQVQVTQEAVLLIDTRLGFFFLNNGVHVPEATNLYVRLYRTYSSNA